MTRSIGLIALACLASSAPAFADDHIGGETARPPAPPPPSMTLKEGGVLAAFTFEIGLTAGKAYQPVSFAPDLSYGMASDFTLSLVHSNSAASGFRGAAGNGFCVTDPMTGSCPRVYQNFGFEGLYSLSRGTFAAALNAGVLGYHIPASPESYDFAAKLGAKAKLSAGPLYLLFSPSVWLAVTQSTAMGMKLNKDQVWLPISLWVKPAHPLDLGVASGIKGPVAGFAKAYTIPIGMLATVAINKQITIGSSFVFGKIVGGSGNVDAMGASTVGPAYRSVHIWFAYKM